MAYPVPDKEFMSRLGEALATFYSTLVNNGIPVEFAETLTRDWYDDFNDWQNGNVREDVKDIIAYHALDAVARAKT